MIKALQYKNIILYLSLLSVSACTDNGLLFRSFGRYDTQEHQATYKVERPYQIKNEWYTPQENYQYREKGIAGWYHEENGAITANGEKYDASELTAMHKTLPLPSIVRITNLENGNVAIVRINDRGPFVNNRLIDVSQKTAEALEFNMTGTTLVEVEILPNESKMLKQEILEKYGSIDTPESVNTPQTEKTPEQASEEIVLYQPDTSNSVLYNGTTQAGAAAIVSVTQPPVLPAETVKDVDMPKTAEPSKPQDVSLITPISGHYIQAGAFSNINNAQKVKVGMEKFGPVQISKTSVNETVLHRVRMGPFETAEEAKKLLQQIVSEYPDAKIIFEP